MPGNGRGQPDCLNATSAACGVGWHAGPLPCAGTNERRTSAQGQPIGQAAVLAVTTQNNRANSCGNW